MRKTIIILLMIMSLTTTFTNALTCTNALATINLTRNGMPTLSATLDLGVYGWVKNDTTNLINYYTKTESDARYTGGGGNTTEQMRSAINNTGIYNITINASNILNSYWLTSYTETDSIFKSHYMDFGNYSAERSQVYTNISLMASNVTQLWLQRPQTYTNLSLLSGNVSTLWLERPTVYSNITARALPATCSGNQFVQNTTTTGVQCYTPSGTGSESDPIFISHYADFGNYSAERSLIYTNISELQTQEAQAYTNWSINAVNLTALWLQRPQTYTNLSLLTGNVSKLWLEHPQIYTNLSLLTANVSNLWLERPQVYTNISTIQTSYIKNDSSPRFDQVNITGELDIGTSSFDMMTYIQPTNSGTFNISLPTGYTYAEFTMQYNVTSSGDLQMFFQNDTVSNNVSSTRHNAVSAYSSTTNGCNSTLVSGFGTAGLYHLKINMWGIDKISSGVHGDFYGRAGTTGPATAPTHFDGAFAYVNYTNAPLRNLQFRQLGGSSIIAGSYIIARYYK